MSSEGSALLEDFAPFAQLAMADLAEAIEALAGEAKEGLRKLDARVQEGEHNLGRKKESEEEQRRCRSEDSVGEWHTPKYSGSKVIGVGQNAKASAEETVERMSSKGEAC